jgi:hypothetical protein
VRFASTGLFARQPQSHLVFVSGFDVFSPRSV